MKKILFLLGLLVSHITSFAFNTSTNFGFNQQKTEEEYQHLLKVREEEKAVALAAMEA